jgi:hypothetical protein
VICSFSREPKYEEQNTVKSPFVDTVKDEFLNFLKTNTIEQKKGERERKKE